MSEKTIFQFQAIGTHWTIEILDGLGADKKTEIEKCVHDRIAEFDQTYSRFKPESWIRQAAENPGRYLLPADAKPLFAMYEKMYHATDGYMTPLIGQMLVDAGYDEKYSLQQTKTLEKPQSLDEVMSLDLDAGSIEIKQEAIFDFGACGKGYLIDLVGDLLKNFGIQKFTIDAGGDILHFGEHVRIGLEDPENLEQVIGVIEINNQAIAGSAGNRRSWGKFHHIMNPKTLESQSDFLAIWVVAETAILADALTTALAFCSAETLQKEFQFKYVIVRNDRSVEGTLLCKKVLELF